ncbi:MAG TPA: nucleotidyl transferase AbiEii/AbiGii toxin family protein [Patescibacteria group bacterium]|nr:nucleotidyl transferase AbiEii/AbiGii toxin family protein [Patescibacteria group bacterium]
MTKNISSLHLEILDKERKELLNILLPFTKKYALGGGTALALQINHRKSFDFDFFSSDTLPKNLLEKLSQSIQIKTISVDTSDELTFLTKNDLKVTFLYYPFRYAYPLEEFDNDLSLFTVKDIAIKKAYTIGRRGEYRDYFDLYTILKEKYMDLKELIIETKKIYGSVFEEKIFLQQLVYFDDLLNFDIIPVSSTSIPTKDEVKQFLEELVKGYVS